MPREHDKQLATAQTEQPLEIGQKVRDIRKKWGMTQAKFGAMADISHTYLSAIELGRQLPSPATEQRLMRIIEEGPEKARSLIQPKEHAPRRTTERPATLRQTVTSSRELFKHEIQAQPDGTITFVLSAIDFLEWGDSEVRNAIRMMLQAKPHSRLYYCFPTAAQWDWENEEKIRLDFLRNGRVGAERSAKFFHDDILETPEIRERIKLITLSKVHYFHPIAKTILYQFPQTGANVEPERAGYLEVRTAQEPVFVRLHNVDVDNVFHWLKETSSALADIL